MCEKCLGKLDIVRADDKLASRKGGCLSGEERWIRIKNIPWTSSTADTKTAKDKINGLEIIVPSFFNYLTGQDK